MSKNGEIDTTLYCSECGGTNVQVMAWVEINTKKYCENVNNPMEEEDCWCADCKTHTTLMTLSELWGKFGDIPVNNDDEIEKDFLGFPAGTSKFDVWHWFDERCPNGVAEDLMYNTEE